MTYSRSLETPSEDGFFTAIVNTGDDVSDSMTGLDQPGFVESTPFEDEDGGDDALDSSSPEAEAEPDTTDTVDEDNTNKDIETAIDTKDWSAVASLLEQNGVTVQDIVNLVKNQNAQPDDIAINKALLSQQWGVEADIVDTRMAAVVSYWQKLPAAEQAQFDTVEGAMEIWKRIENAGRAGKARTPSRRAQSAQPRFKFTSSQIQKMPPEERAARHTEITAAYANNQVNLGA